MKPLYKKSEAGLIALIIIIVIVFFFGWLVNVSQRECRTNKDCGSESYCGSDFSCHTYPTIQKTVVQYSLFWPAVVIGLAIVITAIIFNWDKIKHKEIMEEVKETYAKTAVEEPHEAEEIAEPYYKSSNNVKTP
ncbi:hypothetical protein HYW20_00795 [Candidatus Woesearchaeota archaeon]|nr:hypothetical protein [Candidatus Woesearchaeota archaeon]